MENEVKFPILIVGLGQLGARYLQGFLRNKYLLDIDIIEPNDEAFDDGINLISVMNLSHEHNIKRVTMQELNERYVACIVATSSNPRPQIISSLASKTHIENWVMEKVLAQSEEQLYSIMDSVYMCKGAWVNTPRRRTSLYRTLKTLLNKTTPIRFEASFPNLGLGCNSIHFIDVLSWLVDSSVLYIDILSPNGWKPSKRRGYSEFEGVLNAYYDDGSMLSLNTNTEGSNVINVQQGDKVFSINESEGIYIDEHFFPGLVEYQSDLSNQLILEIINGKVDDGLPTLQQSILQHKALFEAIKNCSELQVCTDKGIPIT